MTKSKKIIAGLVVMAAAFAAIVTPALAAPNEFSGKTIKATGEAAAFVVSGGSVTCATNSGKGGVASKAQAKIELTFEKCTASAGESVKEDQAKVTTCSFNFKPEGSVALESGCVTEFKVLGVTCAITPSVTENTGLEEVGYLTLKEEKESSEANILADLDNMTYSVSKPCETDGLKKGSAEGELVFLNPMVAKGLIVANPRKFVVGLSNPLAVRRVGMTSTTEHEWLFQGTAKYVKCGEANFFGEIGENTSETRVLEFGTIKYTSCKTNILGAEETAAMTASACRFTLQVMNSPLIAGPFRSILVLAPAPEACRLTIKVGTCTVTVKTGGTIVQSTNTPGTPATVKVKFTRKGGGLMAVFGYSSTETCTTLAHNGVVNIKGESKVGAETFKGTGTSVEIM